MNNCRIYFFLLLLFPLLAFAQDRSRALVHTVERGETLYSISKMYGVSESEIMERNRKTDNKVYSGEVLYIPNKGVVYHTIVPGETLYQLSVKYGVSVEDICKNNPGLDVDNFKAGQVIVIPASGRASTGVSASASDDPLPAGGSARYTRARSDAVNVVLAMPFTMEGAEQQRIAEFYEGVLLGLNECKQQGISVNLDVYDLNAMPVHYMLSRQTLRYADLVIGPFKQEDIRSISEFSKKEGIPFLVPFTSDVNDVFGNPFLFQVNTPQSYLYSDVYANFVETFRGANVIVISDEGKYDKKSFIDGLMHQLSINGISAVTLPKSMLYSLSGLLSDTRPNVVVPGTGDQTSLSEILPALQTVVRGNKLLELHLFGYPEWQTYTNEFISAFYELDTYFFTPFYANPLSEATALFSSKYHSWYKKDMMNTYPKYGMLGYDLVSYFLPYLWRYGGDFYSHLNTLPFVPVQTGFKFERVNNWGGFLNRKVFFVHFSKDYGLHILDFE